VPPILATVVYLFVAKRSGALGGFPRWFERGRLDGATWLLIVASLVVSSTALVAWFALAKPDYGEVVAMFPEVPTPALFVGVVMFAVLNAALEETIYRGVVMGALDASLGAGMVPVLLQAVLFGILHINGFPRGPVGIGLATIYGMMMGLVRRKSGGMLAPWIAHVGTDVTIGSILLTTTR
jgi:membrane protease YdiL (CAAX protease family)